MSKRTTYVALAVLAMVSIVVPLMSSAGSGKNLESQVNSDLSLLNVSSEGVTIEFYPPRSTTGSLETELYKLEGGLLAKVTRRHRGRPLQIELYAQIDKKDLSNYYL